MAPVKVAAAQVCSPQAPLPFLGAKNDRVCDICGDSGFKEMLALCTLCNEGSEHIYCMQTLMEVLPEKDWVCERCKYQKVPKCKDTSVALLPSRSHCSGNAFLKGKQGKVNVQVSTRLKDGTVSLNRNAASKTCTPSATGFKRAASGLMNVSDKIPKVGITHLTESVGISASQRSLSKKNSFKAPDTAKVKFLSPSLLGGVSLGGAVTVDSLRSRSGKFSKVFPASPPKTQSTTMLAVKLPIPSSSTGEGIVATPAERAGRSEAAVQISSSVEASMSSLYQSGTAKFKVPPRSASESLPSVLLSSKPPKVLKGQEVSKYNENASGVVPSRQSTEKHLARLSTKNSFDVNIRASLGADDVSEKDIMCDSYYSVDAFTVDQEMGQTSSQLLKSSAVASTSGEDFTGVCVRYFENVPSVQLNAPQNDASTCAFEKIMPILAKNASGENPLEMSETPVTKLKGLGQAVAMPSGILKLEAPCTAPSHASDAVAKLVEVVSTGTEDTLCVEHSDKIQVNQAHHHEKKSTTMYAASADLSDVRGMKVANIEPNYMNSPLRHSGVIPSTWLTRCCNCKELGHSSQGCHGDRNSQSFDLESGQKADQNVTHANKTSVDISCASRCNPKVLEPSSVDDINAVFCTSTASLSCELLTNRQHVHLEGRSDLPPHGAIGQHPLLSNIKNPCTFLEEGAAFCPTVNNVCQDSTLDQICSLGKVEDTQRIICTSDLHNSCIDGALQSVDTLQSDELTEKRAALDIVVFTYCNTQSVSSKTALQVQNTELPLTVVSNFVPAASIIDKKPVPTWQTQSSYTARSGNSFSEAAHTGSEDQNGGKLVVPFPGCTTFGVRIRKVPALPKYNYLWRGGFQIVAKEQPFLVIDGIEACASMKATNKIHKTIGKFPSMLQLEEMQHTNASGSWLKQLMLKRLNDGSIDVFFFATDSLRQILDRMIVHDLALKGVTDYAELFLFPSSLLPEGSQRVKQNMFIWGVFHAKGASEMDCVPKKQFSSGVGLDDYQAAHVFSSSNDFVAERCTPLVTLSSQHKIARDDMDLDVEAGPKVNSQVVRLETSNAELDNRRRDVFSIPFQATQTQQLPKSVDPPQTSHMQIPTSRISEANNIPLKISPHYFCTENINSCALRNDVDLPPGFGPLVHATSITSNTSPDSVDRKRTNHENGCRDRDPSCNPFKREYNQTTRFRRFTARDVEKRSLRPSHAVRQLPPFYDTRNRGLHNTQRSFSYSRRYFDYDSEELGYYKRSGHQERLIERDPINRSYFTDRWKYRDFGSAFSYRRDIWYHDYGETNMLRERNEARYWDRDERYSNARRPKGSIHFQGNGSKRDFLNRTSHNMLYSSNHRRSKSRSLSPWRERDRSYSPLSRLKQKSDKHESEHGSGSASTSLEFGQEGYSNARRPKGSIHFQGNGSKRDSLNRTSRNMFYSSNHRRSKPRSLSPWRERDWSYSPLSRLKQKSDKHESEHGSGSASTSLESGQEGYFTSKSEVKQHEDQVVQAGAGSDFSADSVNGDSNVVEVSCAAINGSRSKAKGKLPKKNSIPIGVMVTEVSDSSPQSPGLIERSTTGLSCSLGNERLDSSSKVPRDLLFMKEDSPQKVAFGSRVLAATERTFLPGVADTATLPVPPLPPLPCSELATDRENSHAPGGHVFSPNMGAGVPCEDPMGLSKESASPHSAKGEEASSLDQTRPLFLFIEQSGLVRTRSNQQPLASATPTFFPEKLSSCETSEESSLFDGLNLTLGIPLRKASRMTIEKEQLNDHDDALNLSLKL